MGNKLAKAKKAGAADASGTPEAGGGGADTDVNEAVSKRRNPGGVVRRQRVRVLPALQP